MKLESDGARFPGWSVPDTATVRPGALSHRRYASWSSLPCTGTCTFTRGYNDDDDRSRTRAEGEDQFAAPCARGESDSSDQQARHASVCHDSPRVDKLADDEGG